MKVLISSGLGRLHFFTTAVALARGGVDVRLLGGWVPRKVDSFFVRMLSRIVGYDLRAGLKKRQIASDAVEVVSFPVVDFVDQFLIVFCRKFLIKIGVDPLWAWKLFGWRSRSHMTGCEIFHVRSGVGQGGAIAKARKLGLKVIVDHSIAHPAFMERQLKAEYMRYGVPFDLGMDSSFWRMVVKDCEQADVLLVNSDFVKSTFVAEGYPEDRVKVAYLGVPDLFANLKVYSDEKDTPEFRFLFTGAFGFRKGGEYILEALKILMAKNVHSFHMDFVGSTSQGASLIAAYEKDCLPVTFHGPMSQEKMSEFFKTTDVYVFPSLSEGCAKSGMEAMSAGLCVVSTYESGLPIEDGTNGYLVPSKNAEALAEQLSWLMDHYDAIVSAGRAAAQTVQGRYSEDAYVKELKRIYLNVLENRS